MIGFTQRYETWNATHGKKQFLVPYLMSSHPGSDLDSAIKLAEYLRDINHQPQQVQDFYPTPATASTTMYYTGIDPRNMKPVYVPKKPREKAMQRALIQYRKPQNYQLVKEALLLAGREDLIGFDKHCLIRPRPMDKELHNKKNKQGRATGKSTNSKNHGKSNGKNAGSQSGKRPKKKTIRNVHKKKKR